MKFQIELDREEDGRWIAEIASLPGVLAYGKSKQEAVAKVKALALRVLADEIEKEKKDKTSPSPAAPETLAKYKSPQSPECPSPQLSPKGAL